MTATAWSITSIAAHLAVPVATVHDALDRLPGAIRTQPLPSTFYLLDGGTSGVSLRDFYLTDTAVTHLVETFRPAAVQPPRTPSATFHPQGCLIADRSS